MTLPAHPEFLTAFATALQGGAVPEGLIARDTPRGLAVYRNNVAAGLRRALQARFPVVERLVGQDFFAALARVFVQAHPPHSPVMAEWGADFPVFLAAFPPLAAYPYLADVARVEFARGLAFHAADAMPIAPGRLAAMDPDRHGLALHPSVMLLRLSHPAVAIWARNQQGAKDLPLPAGPQTALILRDAAFAVPVTALPPGDAAMAGALLAGHRLTQAAAMAAREEPGRDPQPLLVHLMRAGAIISLIESPTPCP